MAKSRASMCFFYLYKRWCVKDSKIWSEPISRDHLTAQYCCRDACWNVNRLWKCGGPVMTPLTKLQGGRFACVVFNQQFSVCTPFMHYGWGTWWTTSPASCSAWCSSYITGKPLVLQLYRPVETQGCPSLLGLCIFVGAFLSVLIDTIKNIIQHPDIHLL